MNYENNEMNFSRWKYIQFVNQTINFFQNDNWIYALFIEFSIFQIWLSIFFM